MNKYKLTLFLLLSWTIAEAQFLEANFRSNPDKTFSEAVQGVEYIMIVINETDKAALEEDYLKRSFYNGVKKYFEEAGFSYSAYEEAFSSLKIKDSCQLMTVEPSSSVGGNAAYADINLMFTDCAGDQFAYRSDKDAVMGISPRRLEKKIAKRLRQTVGEGK